MGPIRAFSRPSHGLAAGELVASASPYSHTPGYPAARRPYCAHPSSPLGSHHSALSHPHLFGAVCAADPLRAGLVSSPAAPTTCLFHFKTLLPPGAASPDTHLAVPAQQDTRGVSQGTKNDVLVSERVRKDIIERGCKDDSECERKSKEERKSKNKSAEKKLRKGEQRSKNKHHNGAHKRHERKSNSEWEKCDDNNAPKKNNDEIKCKNKHNSLTWKKHQKEHRWTNNEDKDFGNERRERKWSKDRLKAASASSPASKADDPCTSRMSLVFPFSDDDDDGYGHDGGGKESNEEPWPISDIVETEDEEGEHKARQTEDLSGENCEGSLPQHVSSALNDAEAVGVFQQQQQVTPATENTTQNENSESEEKLGSVVPSNQRWQDSPPTRDTHDVHKDFDTDEELQLEEQVEHDNEDKRRSGEEEWPKDGVRATQRLRPRSYR